MSNPIYSLSKIKMSKLDKNIISINNFSIHRGTIYLFSGPHSSGKTALINLLENEINNYNGELKYENKAFSSYSKSEYKKDIAVVHQVERCPWGTVGKYLKKTLKSYGHIRNIEKNFNSIISKMHLQPLLNIKMSKLTPGQFRWVCIAAKIAVDSKVLFIDEIEQHLDLKLVEILRKILYAKANYDGVTIIATTLNPNLFNKISSVSIVLDKGRIASLRSNVKHKKTKKTKK